MSLHEKLKKDTVNVIYTDIFSKDNSSALGIICTVLVTDLYDSLAGKLK